MQRLSTIQETGQLIAPISTCQLIFPQFYGRLTSQISGERKLSEATDFWSIVKKNLTAKNSNHKILQTWFEPTELLEMNTSEKGCNFKLGVPTQLHKYWIIENLFDRICSEISAIYRKSFTVEFVVTGVPEQNANNASNPLEAAMRIQETASVVQKPQITVTKREPELGKDRDVLNPDYLFSTFVVGRNNEFAHAASYNVARNPGADGYNPLFICGPVGMGKTHLLNAVGQQIKSDYEQLRICYVSAERFLNECISAIRRNEMEKFRHRYRESCDVLLMDDVQFLGRGEAVQEEFFHTLNDFFEKKQQVIVASDRMPKDILGLEDRIRSRLEWGLIADIQMPDLETRVAILKYKAERMRLDLADEVVSYIARISKRSIRELEGNLKKVKMFSELQGFKVDIELTKKVLKTHDDPAIITLEQIQQLVCDHFRIRLGDLKGKSRSKSILIPRQVCMFLIKTHMNRSLMDIGRAFGGKDHTTVMNALSRVSSLLQSNSDLKRDIDDLTNRIHNITGV